MEFSTSQVDKFESILSFVYSKWDGIVLVAGDINFDFNDATNILCKYRDVLDSFKLTQDINTAEYCCVRCSTYSWSEWPWYAIYVIINARVDKFEPRYKYTRLEKTFDVDRFLKDISELPFSVVYIELMIRNKNVIFQWTIAHAVILI